jgi:hypothetical protein
LGHLFLLGSKLLKLLLLSGKTLLLDSDLLYAVP